AFDPSGTQAILVGYEHVGTADTGVLIQLDDAMWRAGSGAASFVRAATTRAGERFSGIEWPTPGEGPGGGDRPVVVSQSGASPYNNRLRDLDPATLDFGSFVELRGSSAGADDLAFADNEFGGWGIVVICGTNGADVPYYTEIG